MSDRRVRDAHHRRDERGVRTLTWRNDFMACRTGWEWPPSLGSRLGPEPCMPHSRSMHSAARSSGEIRAFAGRPVHYSDTRRVTCLPVYQAPSSMPGTGPPIRTVGDAFHYATRNHGSALLSGIESNYIHRDRLSEKWEMASIAEYRFSIAPAIRTWPQSSHCGSASGAVAGRVTRARIAPHAHVCGTHIP